jgi:hypothetical protein
MPWIDANEFERGAQANRDAMMAMREGARRERLPTLADYAVRPIGQVHFPEAESQELATRWLTASNKAPNIDNRPRNVLLPSTNLWDHARINSVAYFSNKNLERLPDDVKWTRYEDGWKSRNFWPAISDPVADRHAVLSQITNPSLTSGPVGTMPIRPDLLPGAGVNPTTVFWQQEAAAQQQAGILPTRPWSPQPQPRTDFTGYRHEQAFAGSKNRGNNLGSLPEAAGAALAELRSAYAARSGLGALQTSVTPEQEQARIDKAMKATYLILGAGAVAVIVAFVLRKKLGG